MAARRRMLIDEPTWSCRVVREESRLRRFSPVLRTTDSQIGGVADMLEKLPSKVSRAGSRNEEQTTCEDAVEEGCALSAGSTSLPLNDLLSSYEIDLRPGISNHTTVLGALNAKRCMNEIKEMKSTRHVHRQATFIGNWACLNFSSMDIAETVEFLSELCLNIEMDFLSEPTILCPTILLSDTCTHSGNTWYSDTWWGVYRAFEQVLEKVLVIVILPDIRDFDVKLKGICKEFQFVCRCFMPQDTMTGKVVFWAARDIRTKLFKRFAQGPPSGNKKLGIPVIDIFKDLMGEAPYPHAPHEGPLKPSQQISAVVKEEEDEEEEVPKERTEEVEDGLETVGEDDHPVLFGPEDIRKERVEEEEEGGLDGAVGEDHSVLFRPEDIRDSNSDLEDEKEEEEKREERERERMQVDEEEKEDGLDESVGEDDPSVLFGSVDIMGETPYPHAPHEGPLKPPQQISAVVKEEEDGAVGEEDHSVLFLPEDIRDSDSDLEDENEEEEKGEKRENLMDVDEEEKEDGLDESVGEDDPYGSVDIRDSDSDSFYLEELHSSIDGMEDSEFEDDIFGQMEDDYLEESDCFDKVSDDYNEEDDGLFQLNEPFEGLSPGKPSEEKVDILGDEDVVQIEYGIVRQWACANFSYLSHEEAHAFFNRIVDMCVDIRMEFTLSPIKEVHTGTTDIERTLMDLIKCGRKDEQLGILLVILPEDNHSYDKVENVCVDLGVTFYCCCAREAWIESKRHLKGIAHAIQSKVVMRDARLRRLALPLVLEAPILIFGADVFRCTPRDDNSDYIASVATSLDWPKFRRYDCGFSHDEGSINVSAKLGSLISEFIYSFCKRGKGTVEKIIFFRNGLKGGQFGDICHQEMTAIKKACANFLGGYELHITYVLVLPHASTGMDNISGTGDLTEYKFLCRHSGGKKFSSMACYHVVHDENNFPPGELQALTSKLCSIRDRREYPEIDIVPPAYYAKRGGMMALEEWERTKQLMKSQSN